MSPDYNQHLLTNYTYTEMLLNVVYKCLQKVSQLLSRDIPYHDLRKKLVKRNKT